MRRSRKKDGGNSGGEAKVYDFIINTIPTQGPTIPTWSPILAGFPINSPLIGSFLGVFFGFAINYAYQFWKNRKDRTYYMKAIAAEIDFCVTSLGFNSLGDFCDILPTDRWNATLYSGSLRLFQPDYVAKLGKAYHGIQRFNFMLETFWSQGEIGDVEPQSRELRRAGLLKELKELKEWLNPTIRIKADDGGAYLEMIERDSSPQSPRDRVLWILYNGRGITDRSSLKMSTGMTYADLDTIIAELTREGKILKSGQTITLIYKD